MGESRLIQSALASTLRQRAELAYRRAGGPPIAPASRVEYGEEQREAARPKDSDPNALLGLALQHDQSKRTPLGLLAEAAARDNQAAPVTLPTTPIIEAATAGEGSMKEIIADVRGKLRFTYWLSTGIAALLALVLIAALGTALFAGIQGHTNVALVAFGLSVSAIVGLILTNSLKAIGNASKAYVKAVPILKTYEIQIEDIEKLPPGPEKVDALRVVRDGLLKDFSEV